VDLTRTHTLPKVFGGDSKREWPNVKSAGLDEEARTISDYERDIEIVLVGEGVKPYTTIPARF
jgi:hypothetical protein